MAKKRKSQAQIRRLQARAAARGEVYAPPSPPEESLSSQEKESNLNDGSTCAEKETGDDNQKLAAATQLVHDLQAVQDNESLKAKERRSLKRKAEAIASEAANCSPAELLEWYQAYRQQHPDQAASSAKKEAEEQPSNKKAKKSHNRNPYVVFVGQLSFDTTKESLFQHLQQTLGDEHDITPDTVQIRLLTDAKTKQSRGMAFLELSNPETLHACLKLHQTFLEGRRINVEKSAGGGRVARQSKLTQLRKDQSEYMSGVVDRILDHYQHTSGEIQEGELDDGVVALCKRHSASVVEAALERYVESNGREMDNPSAYLSFLLTKLAEEGIDPSKQREKDNRSKRRSPSRKRDDKRSKLDKTSILSKEAGVDMPLSEEQGKGDLASLFPSFSRGRGRGRSR